MVREYNSAVAHALLRVLDADQTKRISREEWRRGWADGMITKVLEAEGARLRRATSSDESGAPSSAESALEAGTGRMAKKRDGGVTALTAAQAARMVETKNIVGDDDGKKKKKKKKGEK